MEYQQLVDYYNYIIFFFTVMCTYYNNSVYAVCKITINTTTRRSHAFTRTTPVKFQRNIGSFFYRLYYRSSCCIVFASSENIIRAAETTMHAFKRTSPYILCYIIYSSINIWFSRFHLWKSYSIILRVDYTDLGNVPNTLLSVINNF